MSEAFPRKCNAALVSEIRAWHERGIITSEQVEALVPLYPPASPTSSRLISIFMNLGAILVGLGTLLFIAANWQHLQAPFKVLLIFLSIIASYYGGWHFRFDPGHRPKLGTSLLLLGSLFYGGGIWLMSQICNYDTSLANGLFIWASGVSLSAVITACTPVGMLGALLWSVWAVAAKASIAGFALSFGLALYLAYKLRSPWTCAITLVGGAVWTAVIGKSNEFGMILFGTASFLAYLWHRKRWQLMASPYMYVGLCSGLLGLLIVTCDRSVSLEHLDMVSSAAMFMVTLTMAALAVSEDKSCQHEVIGCLSVSIAAFVLGFIDADLPRLAVANMLLLGAMVSLVWSGVNRLQSVAVVNLTIVFFVFDIIARYFDMFFSMMDRSLFFVMGGVLLMAAGAVAERGRRKILEGIST